MLYANSRHLFCEQWLDDEQRLFLDARRPYRYRAFDDNTVHLVKDGESIFSIAGHHFIGQDRAAGLWWIIADFQPEPIIDPTIQLIAGTQLILPSIQKVQSEILGEARRSESRV